MGFTPEQIAALASAIRVSLTQHAALSDQELVERDHKIGDLFHAVAAGATFTIAAGRAFDELSHTLMGKTVA